MTRRLDPAELERLQRALGESPRAVARPAFRERLRDEFVRDAISGSDRAAPRRERRRAPLVWATAMAAMAALVIIGLRLNAGPAWTVAATSGSGVVHVDGRAIALPSSEELARALKPGSRVQLPEGAQIDLALPGSVLLQIVGGSDVTLPGSPGRWFARSMRASLESGELRVSTGTAFPGTRFEVVTPEARAVVTGTTLAVLRQPDASCVCVFDGSVAMQSGALSEVVLEGTRRSVFRDGSAPLVEPIRPMETMKLSMLRDQATRELAP